VAEERGEESGGEQVELARYDTVVGSDEASPELLGRGFVAIVSLDPADPADS